MGLACRQLRGMDEWPALAVPPVVVGPVIAGVGRVVKIDMHYYYMYKT